MIKNNNHRLKSSIYLEHRSSGAKVLAVQLVQQNKNWLKQQPRLNLVPRFNCLGNFQHVNSHFEHCHTPDKTSKKDPPSSYALEQRTTMGGRKCNPQFWNEWASQIKLTKRKGFNCHFERHHAPDINQNDSHHVVPRTENHGGRQKIQIARFCFKWASIIKLTTWEGFSLTNARKSTPNLNRKPTNLQQRPKPLLRKKNKAVGTPNRIRSKITTNHGVNSYINPILIVLEIL